MGQRGRGRERGDHNPIRVFEDPPLSRALFAGTRYVWLWTIVRVYLGWHWLQAGLHKVGDPAWASGEAVRGFWTRAVAVPQPPARPPVAYDWYRSFLRNLIEADTHTVFGPLITWGEVLVGVALLIGALTGIAAFFGAFLNFNFMLAGTASTNPVMFLLAILVMLAWKVAGWWGVDRWLLFRLGTPWQPRSRIEGHP